MRSNRTLLGVLTLIDLLAASGCRRPSEAPPRVFVTNEDSGTVSVIDAARDVVVATIAVGKRPRGLRVSADGRLLYVAVSGSPKNPPGHERQADAPEPPRDDAADGIAVVDVAAQQVVRRLPSGRDPEAFDVSADGKTLFVSNEETAEVSFVDTTRATITHVTKVGGEPEGVTLSPDGTQVYVTSEAASEVDVLGAVSGEVLARIPTTMRPRAVAFSADGAHAYVSAELGGMLHVIDTTSRAAIGQVRTGPTGAKPMGVALAPDGDRAYVANGRAGSVGVVDVASRRLERTIEAVGTRPWGIAITPDGTKLYVAAVPDVAVIDVASGRVVARIATGDGPWGVAMGGRSR